MVRAAIRYGMEPVAAIKSATLNSAREAGLQNLGAVAPGYAADMLLVDDLRELTPSHVFYAGKLVAQEGRLLAEIEDKSYPLESSQLSPRKGSWPRRTLPSIRLYPREK